MFTLFCLLDAINVLVSLETLLLPCLGLIEGTKCRYKVKEKHVKISILVFEIACLKPEIASVNKHCNGFHTISFLLIQDEIMLLRRSSDNLNFWQKWKIKIMTNHFETLSTHCKKGLGDTRFSNASCRRIESNSPSHTAPQIPLCCRNRLRHEFQR